MLIVRLGAGLGNQMYEYMAGYALAKELKQELVLDIEDCVRCSYGYMLDNFNIPIARKILYSRDSLGFDESEFYERTLRIFDDMVILVRFEEEKEPYKDNDNVIVYSGWDMVSGLKEYKNLYMYGGFFQKDKYYEKYWNELKSMFVVKKENEDVIGFRKLIDGNVSVGIHIRRGDMLLTDWAHKMEDDYYRAAIVCCQELYSDCIFCVFSDDIDYAKKMLGADECIYYIHFDGYDNASVNEFYCLSLCSHRILTADSTFGRLADMLNTNETGHVFQRDVNERTKGKPLHEKSKGRTIWLNADDIQQYSERYRYIVEESSGEERLVKYQRFFELTDSHRNHEALQLAFCIYQEKKTDTAFRLCLAENLNEIGAYEESIVELAQLPAEIVNAYFKELILDEVKKSELILLYKNISEISKKCFIIILSKKAQPSSTTYGLIDLAIILSHLGHEVTLVYDPYDAEAEYFLNMSKCLYSDRWIDLGYFHAEKNAVLESGVSDFYNGFAEEELIVVSRDERFFVKENCQKKLRFVTTDGTDLKDEETVFLLSIGKKFELLGEKADYILTQDTELAQSVEKNVGWKDRGFTGQYRFAAFPWEYGYNQRMNQRMIGMAEAILRHCCE